MNLELFLADRASRGHRPLAGPDLPSHVNSWLPSTAPEMVIVDEADWLRTAGLEQLRDFFDRRDLGVTLIGMPGIDSLTARHPPAVQAGSASPTNTSRWIRRLADRDGELLARTRAYSSTPGGRATSRPSLRSSGSSAATSASSRQLMTQVARVLDINSAPSTRTSCTPRRILVVVGAAQ